MVITPGLVDVIDDVGNLKFAQFGDTGHGVLVGFTVDDYRPFHAIADDTGQLLLVLGNVIGLGQGGDVACQATAVIHMAIGAEVQVEDLALSMGFAFAGEEEKG